MARKIGSRGRLVGGRIPGEGIVPSTLNFMLDQLPCWRDDPKRPRVAGAPENSLNSSLCDFLDKHARRWCPMIRFKHQEPQTVFHTVDIGVHGIKDATLVGVRSYSIYEAFMVIECKRLPAPSKDREREYVFGFHKSSGGATGAIQRFKLGLHGANVETAVIVGYVESETFEHWSQTMNLWIAELAAETSEDGCVWSAGDGLGQFVSNAEQGTASVLSNHQRVAGCQTASITIHHLWVAMTT